MAMIERTSGQLWRMSPNDLIQSHCDDSRRPGAPEISKENVFAAGPQASPLPDGFDILLARAVSGDDDALDAVIETVALPHLRRVVARILRSSSQRRHCEPDDLVQDCLQRVILAMRGPFDGASRFRGGTVGEFAAWLARIAERQFIRQSRWRRARRRGGALTRVSLPIEMLAAPPRHCPQRAAQRAELCSILAQAIAGLPSARSAILMLRVIEQLPYEEIASRTGRSVEACRMQFARALDGLRRNRRLHDAWAR